ncbi:MAG: ABC transporter ATP-binding protein [Moraxellaceae bacterium]|nr:ABC transporter ATP-binding protein [Moraxellaceae bacterium]MCP5177057.1 ABC transporter ATP-binding protein [Moraxellaceae bacterium]HQV22333.1 ABC transporter ATP-binding protein [Agitococcus sp.]
MTTPIYALRVTNLNKTIATAEHSLTILQQITLQIEQGATVAIVGSSGSGKSTLLGLLAGLDTPSAGSIELLGHELTTLSEDERASLRQQYVGFVFQSFHLLPHLTALENVLLPLSLSKNTDSTWAKHCLEQVGLGHRLHHTPKQLSGGEQQRVAIARAFACKPKVLFADEPTGNLDSQTGQHIIDLLFNLNAQHGTTLVLVTHDLKLAEHCQQRVTLAQGQMV